MSKINDLIAGSTGYIGIKLVKLLIKHPNINIFFLPTISANHPIGNINAQIVSP